MPPLEKSQVEDAVLSAVKSSVSSGKARTISVETPLCEGGARIDYEQFHGLIHDLVTVFNVEVSPEAADDLFQENPTVGQLASYLHLKLITGIPE